LRQARFVLPLLVVALAAVLAVRLASAQAREPYEFKVDPAKDDITAGAGELAIEPRFRAVADDRFPYEVYFNTRRHGSTSEGGRAVDAFTRHENWLVLAMLELAEDEQEGRTDLRLGVQYEQLSFLVDNGRGRYAGYIGPGSDGRTARFQEVLADGTRSDVLNIPGWVGINATNMESARSNQSLTGAASAFFSVDETGRLYNDQYFADFNVADQRNQPGLLVNPVHLALGLSAQFNKGTRLKIGETVEVTRRFPVGPVPGATAQYRFTYRLERLYGTLAEPAAARFSFTAVPVTAAVSQTLDGIQVRFDAPEVKNGVLLYDLAKGVAADVTWSISLRGTATQAGLSSDFGMEADFRATLRRKPRTGS
jgi:hypothetical protein